MSLGTTYWLCIPVIMVKYFWIPEVYCRCETVNRFAGLCVSPVGAVVQAVVEGFAEDRVLVVDPPGGLQDRVQQAVSSCAVPQGVETAVQACPQLQGPVYNGRLLF